MNTDKRKRDHSISFASKKKAKTKKTNKNKKNNKQRIRQLERAESVWTLRERPDLDMVQALLCPREGLPLDHRDRSVLQSIQKHTDRESGLHRVEYYHSKHRQSGRLYASNSLQRLSSKVRNLCVPSKVIDMDMTNAHPDILWQVFDKHGISAPSLKEYNSHRERIITGILQSYPVLTRKDIKKAFIVAQNQGYYQQATGGRSVELLGRFTAEMKTNALRLYDIAEYSEIRAHVANAEKSNLLGSFIFMICEDIEIKMITAARLHLQRSGFVVRVNMYDGMLVEQDKEQEKEQQEDKECILDLDVLEAAVEQATNYMIKFVEKPIVRCTLEEVCNRLVVVPHSIDPTDKVVLFGLEKTLTYKGSVRPGAKERLCLLQQQGTKVGLFTTQPRRFVDLDLLQTNLGLVFDVVLTGEDCYPSGSWTKDVANSGENKHKSISHHFPDNPNVVCIDANPEGVAKKDRAKVVRVSMWTGDEKEEEKEEGVLGKAIDRATSEVFASRGVLSSPAATTCDDLRGGAVETTEHRVQQVLTDLDTSARNRSVRVLQSSCPLMGQDPNFDARKPQGKQLVRDWGKLVMYKGYIGAGKTWCVTTAVIEWIQQNRDKKVVYVVPFRNLSVEQTANLRAAARGPHAPRIHFYREGVPAVDAGTWDILVVCPMSLYKFNFADVGLIVIDELSAVNNQLVGWLDEDSRVSMRLEQAVDIIKCTLQNPRCTILLCGAQANKFEQERILALVDIDSSVDMLMYTHSGTGPVIPIVRLDSLAHAINFMWYYYMQGERVAIHFRHASDVRDAARYAAIKAKECGVEAPRFLEWTQQSLAEYKGVPHPAEDVTMYLNATEPQIMGYTTALNPGMSVNAELFDRRIMAEPDTGSGAGSKVIAQMPGRMRKIQDPTILLYAPDQSNSHTGDINDNEIAAANKVMQKLAKLPGANVETVLRPDGVPECRLKPGLRNNLKLEAAVFAAKGVTFDSIRAHIGDTRLVPTPKVVSSKPDPLWLKIRRERGQDLDSSIDHYNNEELVWMRVHTNKFWADVLDKSERIIVTARMLPRRFVTAGAQWVCPDGDRLSNSAFNLVDTHFNQFMAMQLFVWTMFETSGRAPMHRMERLRAQAAIKSNKTALDISADADLTVLVLQHLCTLVCWMPASDMTMQVYKPDRYTSVQAHNWLTANWNKVKTLSSRNAKMPDMPPNRGDVQEWERCLRRVFKTQLGVGVQKQRNRKKNKKQIENSTHVASSYIFITGSLWRTLAVDLPSYITWLLGRNPPMVTVSPSCYVPCDLCDLDGGGNVECVFQGGVARCVSNSSLDCDMHRDLAMPLDVGTAKEFADRIAKRKSTEIISLYSFSQEGDDDDDDDDMTIPPPVFALMCEQQDGKEAEQQTQTKMDPEVVDRLLKFLGFVDGVNTSEPVSVEGVLVAVANNEPLSQADQAHVTERLALSMSTVIQWSNARQITLTLRKLAISAELNITTARVKRDFTRSRAYTVTTR